MEFTINSRRLEKIVTFSTPGTSYIYVDLNEQSGTLGNQICEGGSTAGSTMTYCGTDDKVFSAICRNWFSQYLRKL